MEYNFMWSTPTSGAPIVSFASYGITFNSSVIEILNRPEKIMVGFDAKNKVVGIKPTDSSNIKGFPFAERERNGYVRIGNKDFIKYISAKLQIDFQKAVRFVAEWDEENKILIVDLSKPMEGAENTEEEYFENE
ncbi:MAG: hypothetical protein ACOX47_05355 [Bacillota bacterium]